MNLQLKPFKTVPVLKWQLTIMASPERCFRTGFLVESRIHGTKPGPLPHLNKNEEANLAEFLEVVPDVGYAKPKSKSKQLLWLSLLLKTKE